MLTSLTRLVRIVRAPSLRQTETKRPMKEWAKNLAYSSFAQETQIQPLSMLRSQNEKMTPNSLYKYTYSSHEIPNVQQNINLMFTRFPITSEKSKHYSMLLWRFQDSVYCPYNSWVGTPPVVRSLPPRTGYALISVAKAVAGSSTQVV